VITVRLVVSMIRISVRSSRSWIRTARLQHVKKLEDFNLDDLLSLSRDMLAHLVASTFVPKAGGVTLFGPPRTEKTHLVVSLVLSPLDVDRARGLQEAPLRFYTSKTAASCREAR
jgi:hypothetical protein